MKSFFEGIIVIFSMFSKIPMPRLEWNKKNTKSMFLFFPIIGIVVGTLEALWSYLANRFSLGVILYGAVATVIPIIITGGIHIDGLMDSGDAISSYGTREKRLEIFSDPHVGAFGVLYLMVYLLLVFGFFCQGFGATEKIFPMIVTFSLSRAIGSLMISFGKSAKESGLKHRFSKDVHDVVSKIVGILWIVGLMLGLFVSSVYLGIIVTFLVAVFTAFFCWYSYKTFGGFTGDLIGFSICINELLVLVGIVVEGIIN